MATEDKVVKLQVLKASQDYTSANIAAVGKKVNYNIDAMAGTAATYTIEPDMIYGSYAKSNTGVITEGDNYKRTDYIPTFGGTTLTLSSGLTALCFYDENKTYISGTTSSTSLAKDIPAGAYYWILSLTLAKTVPTITITGANPTLKKDRAESLIRDKVSVTGAVRGEQYPGNLVDMFDWVDNKYIKATDGTETGGSGYFCTGYIPVTAGATYKSNLGRNAAWYASDKSFISGSSGDTIQSGITAPSISGGAAKDAAYIRFSVNKSTDGISNPAMLYLAASTDYSEAVHIPGLTWCAGKTVNWLGDSIIANTSGVDEAVCAALKLKKLTTDGNSGDGGIGGSTIALSEEGTDGKHAMCARYDDMPSGADIIIVSGGTNDFEYAYCPIGTINDADDGTSNNTFYGALKALCRGLIERYPNKPILFTTPIKRMQPFDSGNGGTYTEDYAVTTPLSKNKLGKTLGDYADIIKEVCGLYSIPVLDLYNDSSLNAYTDYLRYEDDNTATIAYSVESKTVSSNTFSYLTHPNALGVKIMARRVAGWIAGLYYPID